MSTRELLSPLFRLAGARWSAGARKAFVAAILMVAASALFALQAALVKLGLGEMAPLELVFFRGLVCVALLLAFAKLRGLSLASARPAGQLAFGVVGVAALVLYFASIGSLPLVTATALNYTAPLFMAVLLAVMGARKASLATMLWVAVAFVGACMVLQPSLAQGDPMGMILGLLSGLAAAVSYLLLARLGQSGEPQHVSSFWFSLVAVVLAGVPTLSAGFSIANGDQAAIVLGIGLLATFAQLAVAKAYSISAPQIPATLSYTTVIFSSLIGAWLWGDQLGFWEALGITLIVASGVLVSAAQASAGPAAAAAAPQDAEQARLKKEYRKHNLRTLYGMYKLAQDPQQTQYVFMISDAQDNITESERVRGRVADPFASPALEAMWQEGFAAPRYDVEALLLLPPETLGGAYARHMKANSLKPDFYDDAEKPRHRMHFLRLRVRQTHDIWHVLTGFKTDEFGEVGLQGFNFGQFNNGQSIVIACAALLKSVFRGRLGELFQHADAFCEGYCSGKRAQPLLAVRWEDLWSENLEELRRRYRIALPQCEAASLAPAAA